MTTELTLDDIDRLKALVHDHRKESVVLDEGRGYLLAVSGQQFHDLKCEQARWDWQQYYRSVRILRGIRRQDAEKFKRFSQAWWKGALRGEHVAGHHDGRFGWQHVPLADRLVWFKLWKKAKL